MNWDEFEQFAGAAGPEAREYSLSNKIEGAYPFWDAEVSEGIAAFARAYSLQNSADGKSHTIVIACTNPDSVFIWCNDNYIEGGNTKPSADVRVKSALSTMNFPEKVAEAKLSAMRGAMPKSTGCHFWTKWNRDHELCKHCNQLLVHLNLDVPATMEKFKAEMLDGLATEVRNEQPVGAAGLPQATLAKLALKTPVLLEGDKGWGKTTEARLLAEEINATLLEIHGNESMEAADIKGYWMRYRDDFVWKDGKLTQAFRLASKGVPVVLLIDEALRIPPRHQSVFLSALSSYKGRYFLETGRIVSVDDGVGTEETLSCSTENLFVVATTNIGAQYAIDEPDPAFLERFIRMRKHTDVELLRRLTAEVAAEKGFPEKVSDQCVEFFEKMKALKNHGFVTDLPNPRTLIRALRKLADTPADINGAIKLEALAWVGRTIDGEPVPEQVDHVCKAVDAVFK